MTMMRPLIDLFYSIQFRIYFYNSMVFDGRTLNKYYSYRDVKTHLQPSDLSTRPPDALALEPTAPRSYFSLILMNPDPLTLTIGPPALTAGRLSLLFCRGQAFLLPHSP